MKKVGSNRNIKAIAVSISALAVLGAVYYFLIYKRKPAIKKDDGKGGGGGGGNGGGGVKPPPAKATLTKSDADKMAKAIFDAMDGYASNENIIYAQLRKVKNDADFVLLMESYGTREISSGKFNPQPNFKGNLAGALDSELDNDELKEANRILMSNGVTLKF